MKIKFILPILILALLLAACAPSSSSGGSYDHTHGKRPVQSQVMYQPSALLGGD